MKIRQTKILGLALLLGGVALAGVGLWLLLSPAQYRATAKILIDPIIHDSVNQQHLPSEFTRDPSFYRTNFEAIRSPIILSNMVANLYLTTDWRSIKRHLRLNPVRNTSLIAITFDNPDPSEAAKVANAIAAQYRHYRLESRRQHEHAKFEMLEKLWQEGSQQILVLNSNMALLRKMFGIQNDQMVAPTNLPPEQKPYWDEMRRLKEMFEQRKLLYKEIESEAIELKYPKNAFVQITDRAEPPQFPVGPNRSLGVVLLAAGLLLLLGGILLLKPARQPAV